MKTEKIFFDDVAAFLAECTRPTKVAHMTQSTSGSESFTGTPSYEAAYTLASQGWPEGLAAMRATRDAVKLPEGLQALTPAPVIAEEGEEVMIDRFLDGEPDHFLTFPPSIVPRSGRVVPLVYNCATSCGVSREQMTLRGSAALALLDALESSGARVELWLAELVTKGQRAVDIRVLVKRAEDALDLDRAAFLLAHPSTLRRLLFRILERSESPAHFAGGYGRPDNHKAADLPAGAIYFASGVGVRNHEEATRLAQRKLDEWTTAADAPAV